MDSARLLVFTLLWTAIWAAPLPRLSRQVELIAGLVPFTAFGLRVFASFFTGVPDDDPVRATVAPLVEWVAGQTGVVPYQVVLDATVALGLVWRGGGRGPGEVRRISAMGPGQEHGDVGAGRTIPRGRKMFGRIILGGALPAATYGSAVCGIDDGELVRFAV